MTILPIFAIIAAITLILLWIFSFKSADPEKRRAYVLPGLIQFFAAGIALFRGGVLPSWIPSEIVTLCCYFFALYLTFTSAISMAAVDKPHRKKWASLWILAAIAFWILAFFG